jgi:hypothetical protein
MNSQQAAAQKHDISRNHNRKARVCMAGKEDTPHDIFSSLQLNPVCAIIIISGNGRNFDEQRSGRLEQLLGRGVARAAKEVNALLMDGGTQAGVMQLMGLGVNQHGGQIQLLGVSPVDCVKDPNNEEAMADDGRYPLDPHHTHFVLAEGNQWGDETPLMFALAGEIAAGPPPDQLSGPQVSKSSKPLPVVTILAGGGSQGISRSEVLHSVRYGWPVIVIEGSGGLADEIAAQINNSSGSPNDPEMAEILEDGVIHLYDIHDSPNGFRKLVVSLLGEDEVLIWAWKRLAAFSRQAANYRKMFYRLQLWMLLMGLFTIILIVFQTSLRAPHLIILPGFAQLQQALERASPNLVFWLQLLIITLPIMNSVFLAASARFNPGTRWVLLRNSAETIKRAIYIYRTRPRFYRKSKQITALTEAEKEQHQTIKDQADRAAELVEKIEFISRELMQTDVNLSSMPLYEGPLPPPTSISAGDDGFSYLTPARYIEFRMNDQLRYFRRKTGNLERELRRFQYGILITGGVGAFLAAVGLELWVALTTAIATSFATYLHYRQTEKTIVAYNQTAINLSNIKGWWLALPPYEQARPENVEKLVDYTERILETENNSWLHQMQDALSGLRKDKEHAG